MKTVFNNRQCAHIWAQQSQPFGRSASMEFDGAVIKSYSTPIAAFVPTALASGLSGRAVLITCNGYSPTTQGKHLTAVRAAVRGNSPVFTVPDIGHEGGRASTLRVGPGSAFKSYKAVHKANLSWMVAQYRDQVARLLRSVDSGEWRLQQLGGMIDSINSYAVTFRVKWLKKDETSWRTDRDAIQARWDRLEADPKRQARAAQRGVMRASRLSENTAKWRAHEYHGNLVTPTALLRVTRPGTHVQTSWGATITVDEARAFAAFWARHRAEGWSQAVGLLLVGPFPLREIAAGSGDCTIGCHVITGAEIEATAALIGEG